MHVSAGTEDADAWGQVARVPMPAGPHRVWVNDRVFRHSLLFDGDDGRMLGAVDAGLGLSSKPPYPAPGRNEVYVVESFYSRGHRGQRTDVVTIYDATSLSALGDVEIPPRVADTGHGIALAALLDGERFLAVFNQAPGSSVSIVDLEERRFVEEITTGGCAGVYPVGPRRFGMLCGDGTALLVELDGNGRKASLAPSEKFFDVVTDPLTVSGVRDGGRWLFASFEGFLHAVDFSGSAPKPAEPWSLFTASERSDEWRVGGVQHLAFHGPTRRLYSVVHQGGPGTHKDPGPEIWVYDVDRKERVEQLDAPNVLFGFIRPFVGVDSTSFTASVLRTLLPSPGVHSISVTQDEAPLLFARNTDLGSVGVLDARSGEHVRDLEEVGLSGTMLVTVAP